MHRAHFRTSIREFKKVSKQLSLQIIQTMEIQFTSWIIFSKIIIFMKVAAYSQETQKCTARNYKTHNQNKMDIIFNPYFNPMRNFLAALTHSQENPISFANKLKYISVFENGNIKLEKRNFTI